MADFYSARSNTTPPLQWPTFTPPYTDAAASHQEEVKVVTHYLTKTEKKGFGVVFACEEPWEAKPVDARITLMRDQLKAIVDTDSGDPAYRNAVKDFYTNLRETWERLVEEVLFSKTVERYGPGVKTMSLSNVVVDDDDYKTIYWAMKRASVHSGHDAAANKELALPDIDEMKNEVKNLDEYRAAIKKRGNKVGDARKGLIKPSAAKIL